MGIGVWCLSRLYCASEVTTLWRYTNLFIIIIIIIIAPSAGRSLARAVSCMESVGRLEETCFR